ncbi:MAG: type II toxin-antitoxin system VapC family toxin [Candidatus Bathyarchaeia archaeon]|jgi:predicted nucleic acid-binding protein
MRILLDTNILVHAYNVASPHQKVASSILERAMEGEIEVCIAQQVLFEFFAVITNSKRVELPLPLDKAADLCLDLWECSEIEKIAITEYVPREVFSLVKSKKLSGSSVFDCILAVSAKVNKIGVIYTENVRDFEKYEFVKVINPFTSEH